MTVEPIQYTVANEQAGGDLPDTGGPNPLLLLSAVLIAVTLREAGAPAPTMTPPVPIAARPGG